MRTSLTRDQFLKFCLPPVEMTVRDKASDAVAYLYTARNGKPAYCVFYGNQSKPVARFYAVSNEKREQEVRRWFEGRKAHAERVAERRASPSSTRVKNAAIKQALEAHYGKGKVRVMNGRGTAHSWIHVKLLFARPKGQSYGEAQGEILRVLQAKGLKMYSYDTADYGSGVCMNIDWKETGSC
jgi:hypothetical protein